MAHTITYDDGRIGTVKVEWTSDAAGDATELISELYNRKIKQVKTVPVSGVSVYSVTLVDTDGYDWFCDKGVDRSATIAEVFFGQTDIRLSNQNLTLTISGAGDTQSGIIYIDIE